MRSCTVVELVCILLLSISSFETRSGEEHRYMPAYDYRCTECAEVFEVTRSMGSTSEECCPSCGSPASRLYSPVGVSFKGTGFHNTDYRPRPKEEGSTPTETPSCPAKTEGSSACASCAGSNN
jgi:putative FmdB family regulatory protein